MRTSSSLILSILLAACGPRPQPASPEPAPKPAPPRPTAQLTCSDRDKVVASESECYQDAPCYPLADGTWCSGSPPPRETCQAGDEAIESSTACLQDDAACYQLSDGSWCTGPRPHGNW